MMLILKISNMASFQCTFKKYRKVHYCIHFVRPSVRLSVCPLLFSALGGRRTFKSSPIDAEFKTLRAVDLYFLINLFESALLQPFPKRLSKIFLQLFLLQVYYPGIFNVQILLQKKQNLLYIIKKLKKPLVSKRQKVHFFGFF